MFKNVLNQSIWNRTVEEDEPVFKEIHDIVNLNAPLVHELNGSYHTNVEALDILSKITGQHIDSSVSINLPLYTDFGKHLSIGLYQ